MAGSHLKTRVLTRHCRVALLSSFAQLTPAFLTTATVLRRTRHSTFRNRRTNMQFQKGQSGNPAGRPRGSRNMASIRMQDMLEQNLDALVGKAVAMALAGEIGALRLCLDR